MQASLNKEKKKNGLLLNWIYGTAHSFIYFSKLTKSRINVCAHFGHPVHSSNFKAIRYPFYDGMVFNFACGAILVAKKEDTIAPLKSISA